jgi:elongation factor Ts
MSIELIKSIRAKTGLPFKDIQKAIEHLESNDEEVIITHLREQGVLKQQARQDRETNQGGIFTYVHDNRLGVMLEVKCETDFVSRSDVFKEFGQDIALHIAAFQPKFVSSDQVDQEFVDKELEISKQQLLNEGKPEDKIAMILEGKKKKLVEEFSLLSQSFLKNPEVSVQDLLASVSQSTGEKIAITRFVIYTLNS